jgi:hypothetical protein
MRSSVAADQRRRLPRRVGRAILGRSQRRELVRQARHVDLMHVHRLQRVVERMGAEMAQRVAILALGGDQLRCGRRDEHLAAMAERQQPRDAVERRAEVVAFTPLRRPDVNGHADRQPVDAAEIGARERLLRVDRSADRVGWPAERRAERVAARLEHLAAMRSHRLAQDLVVGAQRFLHGRAMVEPLETRSLNVGEQECDEIRVRVRGGRAKRDHRGRSCVVHGASPPGRRQSSKRRSSRNRRVPWFGFGVTSKSREAALGCVG